MLRRSRRVVYEEPAAAPPDDAATGVGSPAVAQPVAEQPVAAQPVAPQPAARHLRMRQETVAPAVVNPGAGMSFGTIGFLTLLLGAWAGIVPFVGPIFGYSATGHGSWVWDLGNALLWLVPGAVSVFFGFVMMARAPVARFSAAFGHSGAGLVVACCGAWLCIGPMAWRVLEGVQPIRSASPFSDFIYWVGWSIGPGVLLALLGGAAMGASMLTRSSLPQSATSTTVSDRQVAA